MKIVSKCLVLIVILFATPATLTLGKHQEGLSVAITGEGADFTQGTITDPVLTSITPSAAKQGQSLTVIITGLNTYFGSATGFHSATQTNDGSFEQGTLTISDVWLSQGSPIIDWVRGWRLYNTLFFALFDIPGDANPGKWDVHVTFFQGSPATEVEIILSDGFTVAQPGDITCDGTVNFFDVAVLSNHWLEGTDE
jgi:hypothetical protein